MALVGHTHVIEEHLVSVRFFFGIYIMPHKHLCEPFLTLESYHSIHLFHISKCDVFAYSKYNNNCCLVIEKVYFSPQPSTCQRDLSLANFNLNNLLFLLGDYSEGSRESYFPNITHLFG